MLNDNRVSFVEIVGLQYPLCMTVAANEALDELYGGLNGWLEKLQSGNESDAVSSTVGFLGILLQGGRDRVETIARLTGQKADLPPVLDTVSLKAILTIGEIGALQAQMIAAYTSSGKQTVEVAEPATKNAETTQ